MTNNNTSNNGNGTAATVKVKEFSVNIKDYEDSNYCKKLDLIKTSLSKTFSDETITTKSLATLLAQFLQFYDETLGKNATKRPKLTKIPMKLFKDYSAEGSLYDIFRVMHNFRNTNDWKKFDFKATNRRDKHIEMLNSIHESLISLGFLTYPNIYLEPSLNNIDKLKGIIESHGGKIVDNTEQATHIVKTPLEELDEPNNVEYLRTIEHKQKMNLVHWWYYPDSYDTWLSSSDVEGEEPEIDEQTPEKWVVSPRWIIDTDIFNEWMNEIDYEEEDTTVNTKDAKESVPTTPTTPNKKSTTTNKKRGRKATKKKSSSTPNTPKAVSTPDQEMTDSTTTTTTAESENQDATTDGTVSEDSNKRKSSASNSVPSTPSKKFKQDDEAPSTATPTPTTPVAEPTTTSTTPAVVPTTTTVEQPTPVTTTTTVPNTTTTVPATAALGQPSIVYAQPTSPTIPPQPTMAAGKPIPVMSNPLVGGPIVPPPAAVNNPMISKPVPNMILTPMKQPVPGIPNPSTPQPVAINKTPAPVNTHSVNRPRSSSKSTSKMDTPAHIAQPLLVTNISQVPAQPQFPGSQPISSAPSSTETAAASINGAPQSPSPAVTTITAPPAAKTIGLLSAFSIPPSPCSWFKINDIHEIEKNQLPEFFTGKSPSKNPKIYKEYRDFMINTYLQNPYQYLTLTAIRRNLVGDACSILRVHSFLEHWGLINYFVNPEGGSYIPLPSPQTTQSIKQFHQQIEKENKPSQPTPAATTTTSTTDETTTAKDKESTIPDAPVTSPKESTSPSTTTTTTTTTTTAPSTQSSTIPKQLITKSSPFEFRNNIYSQFKYQCRGCYNDCTKLRFCVTNKPMSLEGQNIPDHMFPMNLCPECFNNGVYPNFLQVNDFTRIEMPAPEMLDEWTDQETLLLLEALDIFADSWADVAEHVGSKTKEQCLLQFLRLPIEDPYLEDNISKSTQITPNEMESSNPLAEMSNPVMSLISFLSTSVSPVVAAAAAKAACDVLTSEQQQQKESSTAAADASDKSTEDKDKSMEDKDKSTEKGETDSMDTSTTTTNGTANENDDYFSKVNIQSAAAAALAAASIKAASLSKVEEKEIQSLILKIVNVQTKKLELKLKYYVELEDGLEKERNLLEKARQNLFAERYSLMKATHTNQQPQPFMTSPNKPLSPQSNSTPTQTSTTTPMNVDNVDNNNNNNNNSSK